MYIKSDEIHVFPATHRPDSIDRAARLTTEKNLTNIINQLTDLKSFIIDGLNVSYSSSDNEFTITAGSCNINGYYIEFLDNQTVPVTGNGTKLYLTLNIVTAGSDDQYSYIPGDDTSTDPSNPEFTGVEFTIDNNAPSDHYLLLAEKDNNVWSSISNNNLKFSTDTIQLRAKEASDLSGLTQTPANTYSDNLYNFIKQLVIDDGDV